MIVVPFCYFSQQDAKTGQCFVNLANFLYLIRRIISIFAEIDKEIEFMTKVTIYSGVGSKIQLSFCICMEEYNDIEISIVPGR